MPDRAHLILSTTVGGGYHSYKWEDQCTQLNNLPVVTEETLSLDSDADRQAGSRAMHINKEAALFVSAEKESFGSTFTSGAENANSSQGGRHSCCCCGYCLLPYLESLATTFEMLCMFFIFPFLPTMKKHPTVLRSLEMWLISGLKYRHHLPYCFGMHASETTSVTNFT